MAVATGSATGRDRLVVLLLAALVFLPGLGHRDVWNPDEARYAEVAREMRATHSQALPRLNGARYTQKPPLFFWLVEGSAWITGDVDETAVRLPSAIAAIGATLLAFLLGERLFGRRAAALAALVFATSIKVLWQGRFGQIDMLLTALVALQVWWFVRGYTEQRPLFYRLLFVGGGLAILAKGPAGFLPPLLAIVAFLLWNGPRAELRRLGVGRGVLITIGIVLLWLVPAGIAGGRSYLDEIVLRQNVTRYASPWHHFAPWYFYLPAIAGEFLPWSALLPAVFVAARGSGGRVRDGFRLAGCWALVTLVFFSLSPAKRDVYVLTLYPALALLVGAALDRLAAAWPARRRWVVVPLAIVALLGVLVLVAIPILGPRQPEAAALGGTTFLWQLVACALPALLAVIVACFAAARGRIVRAAALVGGGMAVLLLLAVFVLVPHLEALKSERALAAELVARMQPGDVYGIYPRLDNTFVYYTGGRPAIDLDGGPEPLQELLRRPGRIWVLAQRDRWRRVVPPPPLVEVARDPDPRNGYLLLARPEMVSPASSPPPAKATSR